MRSFATLLRMVKATCDGPSISEAQLHELVRCMRDYDERRQSRATEEAELKTIGFPVQYHPCDHMERIRFAAIFGEPSRTLQTLLDSWHV